jgi:hypothetical protein
MTTHATYEDQLIELGRASGVTTISGAEQGSPSDVDEVNKLFHRATPLLHRTIVMLSGANSTQFATLWDDKVMIFSHPIVAQEDTGQAVVLGNVTDQLNGPSPAKVTQGRFSSLMTTLMLKSVVDQFYLSVGPTSPDDITSPNGNENGWDRLHVTGVENNNPYQFVAIPLFLARPRGITFPSGQPITGPPPVLAGLFPFFEHWWKGLQYLVTHNEGFSVTVGGPLFNIQNIDHGPFVNLVIHPSIDTDSPQAIAPVSTLHAKITTHISKKVNEAFITMGKACAIQPTTAGAAPVGTTALGANVTPFDMDRFMEGMKELGKNKTSKSETEVAEQGVLACTKYKLMFATVEPGATPNDPATIGYAQIASAFEKICGQTATSRGIQQLQSEHKAALYAADRTKRIDSNMMFPATAFDEPFCKALRSGRFCTHSINIDFGDLKRELCMLHFTTPDGTSPDCKRRINEAQELACSEVTDKNAGDKKTAAGTLYMNGFIRNGSDVRATIANFKSVFFRHIIGFEKSALWRHFTNVDDLLSSYEGTRWLNENITDFKAVPINLIVLLQDILKPYAAIADDGRLQQQLLNGAPASPVPWQQANKAATHYINELAQAINSQSVRTYNLYPIVSKFLSQVETPTGTATQDSNRAQADGSKQPQQKRPKHGDENPRQNGQTNQAAPNTATNTADIENKKKRGFLTWTKTNRPPPCPIQWKKTGSTNDSKFCMFWATKGFACAHNPCNHHHCAKFDQIPAQSKTAFKDWVNGVDGLGYVEGNGPPGT